jgi:hypothetical protein
MKVGNAIQIEAWSRRVMGEPNTLPPLCLPLSRGFDRAARRSPLSRVFFYNFEGLICSIDLKDHAYHTIYHITHSSPAFWSK